MRKEMVESDLSSEKVECTTGSCSSHIGTQGSGLHRDPSFSPWVDESVQFKCELEDPDASIEDSDFELPLLNKGDLENGCVELDSYGKFLDQSMHLKEDSVMEDASTHCSGDGNKKYMPFDLETETVGDMSLSNNVVNGANSVGNCEKLGVHSRSSISSADVLKTLFFILMWYTFSTFLTLYNKTLLGDHLGKFPAPLLMNTIHFTMQAVLSKLITWHWSHRFEQTVPMSWNDYFYRVFPTALSTALDVNLSNASLVFISVTFATMCKSAAPIFLLLFAFAFRLESPSIKLLGIIVVISIGVLLAVAKETEFEFWGFLFVTLAAVMSGFRWCMTQILLQKEASGLRNPLVLMSYLTPIMAVATAALSLFLDPWQEFGKNNYFNNSWHVARSCFLMLFGGTLAFFMVLTEYVLVSVTSAVTVTIAGVVKEAVTILVAVFYFHDEFTWLKGVGLITIMVGVSLFNWYKYQKLLKGQLDTNDMAMTPSTNVAAKYVILEEMDDEDDRLCEPKEHAIPISSTSWLRKM